MADDFLPIPSFYFRVELDGESISFQEVSGLESSLEVEDIIEGGNINKIRLPIRTTPKNLSLSRGILEIGDAFYDWINEILWYQNPINKTFGSQLKTLKIDLISPANNEVIDSWQAVNAYPVRCAISNLNSSENKITVETIEFVFQHIERFFTR